MSITTDKKYPRIYDGNGNLVAILEQAKNVMLTEQLNGSCTLKFLLPRNDPKWEYITDAYYLRVEGKEFALVGTDEERDNTGKLITNVQYEENYLELAGYVGDYLTVEILNTDAGSALTSLLFGKPWSVGQVTVPNTSLRDLVTEKESLLFNLRKVQELWGGYLVFDSINQSVSLFETYGQDNGVQFRYQKNLKSVRKTTDFAGVVTRLYPFGKDGLDISSVEPGGNKYIEDFSYTSRVREGIWVDQQYTDAAKLYEAAQEVLAEIAQPRVSYAVSIVDLSHLTGYEHESFKLGDWVTVIDEELGINVKAQIVKRTYDVLQPWRGSVELANFRPGITDLITEAVKSSRIVGQAVLPNKKISTNALQGYINTATNQINSPNSRLKWDDTGIIAEEVDEQGQPTGKIVKITSGGVGISNDGGLTFHVAMTGDGVLANRVVVNDIYALSTEDGFTKMKAAGIEVWDNSSPPKKRVHLGQYEAGKFGLKVSNGEIYSTKIRTGAETDANYIQLEPPSSLGIYVNNQNQLYMSADQYAGGGYITFGSNNVGKGMVGYNYYANGGYRMACMAYDQLWLASVNGIYCVGDLNMHSGTKNNIEHTENYGSITLTVRESPEQRYIDEGIGVLDNGECKINIDPIFLECIEPDTEYSRWCIHLTPYADVSLYVAEIGENYFVVKERGGGTTTGVKFAWSLSAIRRDYAHIRFLEVI